MEIISKDNKMKASYNKSNNQIQIFYSIQYQIFYKVNIII